MFNPLTQSDGGQVLALLESLSHPDKARRTEAESERKALHARVDKQLGYAPLLLNLASSDQFPLVARQTAAVAFRDVVRLCWHPSKSENVLQEEDKAVVRENLFSVMLGSPVEVRRILSSCIEVICKIDFPHAYPGILNEMISVFQQVTPVSVQDPGFCDTLEATLSTAHAVFARYRALSELDATQAQELLDINANTAAPLMTLLKAASTAASASIQAGTADNLAAARVYVKLLTLTTEVLHDLTTCDLGDQHEKGMADIVGALVGAIQLECEPLLGTKYTAGPLLELRTSALSLLAMYMQQYDEDMQSFAQQIMQVVWDLVRAPSCAAPAADDLVVSALEFFEASCRGPHRELLTSVVRQLCEEVVVPALNLTEEDAENFSDEPQSYIARDIEGSDVHTRRHSACKLVRSLISAFPAVAVEQLHRSIGVLVSQNTWVARDCAIVLVTAIGLKNSSATAMSGITRVASAATSELTDHVDLAAFYESFISGELGSTAISNPDEVGEFVLKADALRFVATFRHHLPAASLAQLLPQIAAFIAIANPVVQTYACHTIERILSLPNDHGPGFRITDDLVGTANAAAMLSQLCGRLREDRQLNEYTVRCLAQVLRALPGSSQPYANDVVAQLTETLERLSKNPSNPLFSHFLFEAIGFTLHLTENNGEQCAQLEAHLWNPLFNILRDDVIELLPYALQVLALLLDLHPSGSAGRSPAAPVSANPSAPSRIPEHFMALYGPLCSKELFEHKGNVPAAIRLIGAFIRKDPDQLHNSGCTPATMELAVRLIQSRLEDHFGFEIIAAVVMHYPRPVLDTILPTLFRALFDRMQARATPKYGRLLALFCAALLARHGAVYFETTMENIQRGMTVMVMEKIVLPVVAKVTGELERKTCAVGLSHAVRDSQALLSNGALWASCVLQCLSLLHLEAEHDEEAAAMVAADQHGSVEELKFAAVEESGVGSKFVQLVSTSRPPEDPCTTIGDPRALFKSAVRSVAAERPADVQSVLQQHLPAQAFQVLQNYL